jgi:hypothetical protein
VFQDAAGADNIAVPVGFCHNIVWSADTYEEMLRRLDGQHPEPLDPDTHVCQTIDGTPLEPTEAAANSLLHGFRRVVIGADSVTLDAGQKRFFTGVLRTVIRVQSGTTCIWPGCCVPVSRCETDHLIEHSRGGSTNPGDGAPLCGMHNRTKQQGYRITRDPDGTFTHTRPNGTTIDP